MLDSTLKRRENVVLLVGRSGPPAKGLFLRRKCGWSWKRKRDGNILDKQSKTGRERARLSFPRRSPHDVETKAKNTFSIFSMAQDLKRVCFSGRFLSIATLRKGKKVE